jgi:hypothetical protein
MKIVEDIDDVVCEYFPATNIIAITGNISLPALIAYRVLGWPIFPLAFGAQWTVSFVISYRHFYADITAFLHFTFFNRTITRNLVLILNLMYGSKSLKQMSNCCSRVFGCDLNLHTQSFPSLIL